MKKILLLFAVLLCAFTAFAYKNSLSANFAPCGVQIATSSIDEEDPVSSKYGIGAELSYQRFLVKGLYVEGGISWNTYLLKGNRSSLTDLMTFVGLSYKVQLSKRMMGFLHVDFTEDTLIHNKNGSEAFGVKTGVGLGFDLGSFTLKASCDGSFGFNKDSEANYVVYRILPMVGCSFNY